MLIDTNPPILTIRFKKIICSTLDDFEQDYDFEPVDALSTREKELIKRTWNKIEMDAERIGANTFGK